MHARVFLCTDACKQKGHFDGCTQRTFGQRMRARYGANPGCTQPTSQMHATPLIHVEDLEHVGEHDSPSDCEADVLVEHLEHVEEYESLSYCEEDVLVDQRTGPSSANN